MRGGGKHEHSRSRYESVLKRKSETAAGTTTTATTDEKDVEVLKL